MIFSCVRLFASNQSFKEITISKYFCVRLLLQGLKTLPLAENVLSNTTVEAKGEYIPGHGKYISDTIVEHELFSLFTTTKHQIFGSLSLLFI